MSNEERAHDFAVMLTSFYLNNNDVLDGEIPNIYPRKDNLVYDPYCIYKYIYLQAIKYFNEDFKN